MSDASFTMPRAMWEKWDAALRSGEYKQAHGALSMCTGYCCLGVLQATLDGDVERYENRTPMSVPSAAWCATKGLDTNFWIAGGSYEQSLPGLNDLCGYSFHEIADVIRERVVFEDGSRP